jgi:nucleoside-diphosphate-sugar epimerase
MQERSEIVLVTGAHGFIGARLVQRLLTGGSRVRALVRRADAVPHAEMVVGDIADPETVREATADVDAVVHCAAYDGSDFAEARHVNLDGTRALAEAALGAGCRRFVHLSTCGVYALEGLDLVDEATPMWPYDAQSPLAYGVTKAEAERALLAVAVRGLPTVVLRPPNVLGPDPLNPFALRIAELLRDGAFRLAGEGDATLPYVHVDNLLDAIETSLRRPEAVGRTYTIVDGHTTWAAYVGIVAGWLGVDVPQRDVDVRDPYDTFRGRFVTDRIRDELGYVPRLSLGDALKATRVFLEERGVVQAGRA